MFLQYLGGTVKRLEAVADHHGQPCSVSKRTAREITDRYGSEEQSTPARASSSMPRATTARTASPSIELSGAPRLQNSAKALPVSRRVAGHDVVQNTALPSGRPRGLLGDRATSQQNEKHRCDPPRLFHGQNPFMQCRFQPDLRPDRSGIPDGANLTVPSRPADHFHAPATGFHPQTERGRGLARISHRIAGLRLGKCLSSASCSSFFGEPSAYRLRWAPPGLFEIEHQG